MEVLRRITYLSLVALALPFFLANKGCEGMTWEHPEASRTEDCQECHDKGVGVDIKPVWHDPSFDRNHGQIVHRFGEGSISNCMLCHTQNSCSDCHLQNPPRDHNQFFRMKGHGLMIGLDRSRCMTCHQPDQCQRCHLNTEPQDHAAGFGSPSNNHCFSCHFPVRSLGAQRCAACHKTTPSHDATPPRPGNASHAATADCRSCHVPVPHPDNGLSCVGCHQ